MEKAERQFHAMLLREMLRPLTQALFSKDGGFSSGSLQPLGSSGNETYAYFLEEALSQQLSQAWPLPSPFGEAGSAASSPRTSSMPSSREPSGLPITRDRSHLPVPSERSRLPISLDRTRDRAPVPTRSTPMAASVSTARPSPIVRPEAAPVPSSTAADSVGQAAQGVAGAFRLPEAEIRRASRLFDLPENLVRAVVLAESGGRADAVSPKGAVGYMQVLPSTGREMGSRNLRDPWQNVYAGTKYLRRQLDRFGNLEHALAAYNAGPGAVERHRGMPPYRETQVYVDRVLAWKSRLDRAGS
jgi:hypothetical protein